MLPLYASQPFHFSRHPQRRVLGGKYRRPSLPPQRLQALHRQNLLAEHLPKLPRRLVRHPLQFRNRIPNPSHLQLQAGHPMVRNPARHNQLKIPQIRGNIERKPM